MTKGFSGLLTSAMLVFLGYLALSGIIGWSPQTMWLLLIGLGIWWMGKKK